MITFSLLSTFLLIMVFVICDEKVFVICGLKVFDVICKTTYYLSQHLCAFNFKRYFPVVQFVSWKMQIVFLFIVNFIDRLYRQF